VFAMIGPEGEGRNRSLRRRRQSVPPPKNFGIRANDLVKTAGAGPSMGAAGV